MIKTKKIFNGKKVLIMGLGTKGGGVESARFAYKNGAEITITDLNNKEYLIDSLNLINDIPKKLVLGEHRETDFADHDIIIKNPGIKESNKFIQIGLKNNKTIDCPIGIFSELVDRPYIGITGTKGKSYTTALVHHILSYFDINTVATGNNCVSPLKYLDKDYEFVLELSSWQLKELAKHKKSPNIACWLNFFEDHLNYYEDLNEYFEDKRNILKYQNTDDYCILPLRDNRISDILCNSKKILFTSISIEDHEIPDCYACCYIQNNDIIIQHDGVITKLLTTNQLNSNLLIPHHFELVVASICIAYFYIKAYHKNVNFSNDKLLRALTTFKGLEHRFEQIYQNSAISVINDSAASTPESVIYALESLENQPIILIAGGGGHKNLSFRKLIDKIIQKNVQVILFNNDSTSDIILALFDKNNYKSYTLVDSLKEAVSFGFQSISSSSGTLLLSPGCSGAPFYKDMFERGNLFKKNIQELAS